MLKLKVQHYIVLLISIMLFLIFSTDEKAFAAEYTLNSTYISDSDYNEFFYNQLDDDAKVIYDELLNNVQNMLSGDYTIDIVYPTNHIKEDKIGTVFQSAIDAFDRDHPEVFWIVLNNLQLSYSVTKVGDVNFVKKVRLGLIKGDSSVSSYLLDDYADSGKLTADITTLEEQVNIILDSTEGLTDYEKVRFFHDWLILNNDYNLAEVYNQKAYKAISAFTSIQNIEYSPVCEGYARAFKVLCDKAGIPCVIASGQATLNAETQGHMWNYVIIDGHWYAIDVTWDDPILSEDKNYDDLTDSRKYMFFLKGNDYFIKSHSASGMFADKNEYFFTFEYPLINISDYGVETYYYNVSVAKCSGGKITTNLYGVSSIEAGSNVKVHVIPDEGMEFVLDSLKCNGYIIEEDYFLMPDTDVRLTAKFMKADVEDDSITVTAKPDNSTSNNNVTTEPVVEATSRPATQTPGSSSGTKKPATSSPATNNTTKPVTNNIKNENSISSIIPNNRVEISTLDDKELSDNEKEIISLIHDDNNSDLHNEEEFEGLEEVITDIIFGVSECGVIYELTRSIFDYDVFMDIQEVKVWEEDFANTLRKKFGNLNYIDTCVFNLDIVKSSTGEAAEYELEHDDIFKIYIPIEQKFILDKEKLQLYYVNDDKLIAVVSEICEFKDGCYFSINVEGSGRYLIVKELEKIEYVEEEKSAPIISIDDNDNIVTYVIVAILVFTVIVLTITIRVILNKGNSKVDTIIQQEFEDAREMKPQLDITS